MWIAIVSIVPIAIGFLIWLVQFHLNKKWETLESFWVNFEKVIIPFIQFLDVEENIKSIFIIKGDYNDFSTRVLDMVEIEFEEDISRIFLYFDEKKHQTIKNFHQKLYQKLREINLKFHELKKKYPGDPHLFELFEPDEKRKQFVKELKDMHEEVLKFISSNAPFRFLLFKWWYSLKKKFFNLIILRLIL